MALPIVNLNDRQARVGSDLNIYGQKINNIQQELADGINEVFERLLLSETYASLDGGKASSVYTTIQIVNGGKA